MLTAAFIVPAITTIACSRLSASGEWREFREREDEERERGGRGRERVSTLSPHPLAVFPAHTSLRRPHNL